MGSYPRHLIFEILVRPDRSISRETKRPVKDLFARSRSLTPRASRPCRQLPANSVLEDLQAALAQFAEISADLKK